MFDVEPRERSRGVPGDIGQEGRETGDVHSRVYLTEHRLQDTMRVLALQFSQVVEVGLAVGAADDIEVEADVFEQLRVARAE